MNTAVRIGIYIYMYISIFAPADAVYTLNRAAGRFSVILHP